MGMAEIVGRASLGVFMIGVSLYYIRKSSKQLSNVKTVKDAISRKEEENSMIEDAIKFIQNEIVRHNKEL